MLTRFLDLLSPEFIMIELKARAQSVGINPMVVVCLQECERMNTLNFTIRFSLDQLAQGLAGTLNITDDMEALANKMFINMQPDLWVKYAYFSLKDLGGWYDDLMLRIQ
jgi:dynein heavy chain